MELTSTGLSIDTQTEIREALEADQRSEISDRLDLSTSSPLGQLNRILSRHLRLVQETALAIYQSIDPDSASGDALDRVAAITGTLRGAATATRVTVVVNVDPGTYAIGTLVANVIGRPGDTFENIEAAVNGGASAADVSVTFEAQTTGKVSCPSNTLEISGPVSGWNAVTSNEEGALGNETQTDAELRISRAQEIANPGSASVPGVEADLLGVDGVESATVYETDVGEITCVVYGPASPTSADNEAVAEQIFTSKAAGIATDGGTSVDIVDSQGNTHTIKFTRPSVSDLTITIDLDYEASTYAGDTALKEAIAAAADAAFVPGLDAAGSMIAAWAHGVDGVLRVTDVTIDAGGSFGTRAVTTAELARIQTSNITVTSTEATP